MKSASLKKSYPTYNKNSCNYNKKISFIAKYYRKLGIYRPAKSSEQDRILYGTMVVELTADYFTETHGGPIH